SVSSSTGADSLPEAFVFAGSKADGSLLQPREFHLISSSGFRRLRATPSHARAFSPPRRFGAVSKGFLFSSQVLARQVPGAEACLQAHISSARIVWLSNALVPPVKPAPKAGLNNGRLLPPFAGDKRHQNDDNPPSSFPLVWENRR